MDKLKATTSSGGKQSVSLSQLLRSSKSSPGLGRKPLPSLEDLQKKLASTQKPVNTRLNLSKALSLNPGDGAFEDKSSELATPDTCDVQVNGAFGAKVDPRQFKNKEGGRLHPKARPDEFSKYGMDLEKVIEKIEKTKTIFFEEEVKPEVDRPANFSYIRLPKHFNPTRGHVNVYRSGLIEIVNKDATEAHRFRKGLADTFTTTSTDLIILNDTLQMTEPINILHHSPL